MVFGFSNKEPSKDDKTSKSPKSAQSDEAAEILKKMEAKKDDGECAFC